MSVQIAEVEPRDSKVPDAGPPSAATHFAPGFDGSFLEPERPGAPARGIVNAVFLSVPFWGLIGFAIYLLR